MPAFLQTTTLNGLSYLPVTVVLRNQLGSPCAAYLAVDVPRAFGDSVTVSSSRSTLGQKCICLFITKSIFHYSFEYVTCPTTLPSGNEALGLVMKIMDAVEAEGCDSL